MLLFIAIVSLLSSAAQLGQGTTLIDPAKARAQCADTPMSLARKVQKGAPKAVPLNMLPPAQTFMAVDRRVDGCPAPLTMVRYRSSRQR